jgi:hypothetical protein
MRQLSSRSKKTDYRLLYKIEGTPFKIAVPYSVQRRFELGGLEFEVVEAPRANRAGVLRTKTKLPDSWLVDLAGAPR